MWSFGFRKGKLYFGSDIFSLYATKNKEQHPFLLSFGYRERTYLPADEGIAFIYLSLGDFESALDIYQGIQRREFNPKTKEWDYYPNNDYESIINEFEKEINDKNYTEENNLDSNYTRSIINLGREIQNGHRKINSKEESLKLSELLAKIASLLELKIKRIESGDDLNNTLGKLELYKDYLPMVLSKSKEFINEDLAQKILKRINEAYRKKAEYIISINEAKLYDTSNKETLIRDLKIASGYFEQTAEILKL